MNTTLPWAAQLAIAALIGLVIGLFLMWLGLRGKNGKSKKEHEALKQEFGQYRQKVDEHFIETAAAVDELNKSYQKVVRHLSDGAHTLMDKDTLQQQLALRGDTSVTVAYLAASTTIDNKETILPPDHSTDDIAINNDVQQNHNIDSETELTTTANEHPLTADETPISHSEVQEVTADNNIAASDVTQPQNFESAESTTEPPKI
ncbi:YhcB family protein [Neisseria montereyensis]|uniref:Z-ring associated protein G n=1 Tax=Neisseria montereyensis TaxID=2973938 RepID=A0ABT2FEZ3_9NEIS|nr:YhcB family protein [Neisseria montereyensis]MCS4534746.1 YhcB family protein [Neisseria montereyensis]